MICALCKHDVTSLILTHKNRDFYQCEQCDLIFVPREFHVTATQEKARYDTHQNDLNHLGYRGFLQKLTIPLCNYLKLGMQGLDFGSGPVPALQRLLCEAGFSVSVYDPYYANNIELLNQHYDFVTCTEVVEHFCEPATTWQALIGLIKVGGYLAIMTQLHDTADNFASWWYKNDSTHITFYSRKTMQWLAENFSFKVIYIMDNVVIFKAVNAVK